MTHGSWCGSYTIPIRCPGCHDYPVFWMRCGCGSSVLFKELGDGWPKHECPKDPSLRAAVDPPIEIASTEDVSWSDDMKAVSPDRPGSELVVVGAVGNLEPYRNIEKKFGVPDTLAGRATLGPLSTFRPGTVTVHTARFPVETHSSIRESITAWTSRTKLRSLQIGDPVRVKLTAYEIGGETVWVVGSLRIGII